MDVIASPAQAKASDLDKECRNVIALVVHYNSAFNQVPKS